jgi:uncharacterized protein (TIGR01777 family)
MKILVTGATGFIGEALCRHLKKEGHTLIEIGRNIPAKCEPVDAVIHLAGEPIAGRWTPAKKEAILHSRIDGLARLAQAIPPPKIFLSASAVGYYGDRGEEILDETSIPGQGFLPEVCLQWEKHPFGSSTRHIQARFGLVIGPGGILGQLYPLYRWGLGGRIGSGQQWVSWISLDDLVRAISFALQTLSGPVNCVSPHPVRQIDFAKTFARHLHRPAWAWLPIPLVHLFLGQMGKELLLASARAEPEKLTAAGFTFMQPYFDEACGKTVPSFGRC